MSCRWCGREYAEHRDGGPLMRTPCLGQRTGYTEKTVQCPHCHGLVTGYSVTPCPLCRGNGIVLPSIAEEYEQRMIGDDDA